MSKKNSGIVNLSGELTSYRDESDEIASRAIGKRITALTLVDEGRGEWGAKSYLIIEFDDGDKIKLFDDGQNCCESRYMHTDDPLEYFVGASLQKIEVKEGPEEGPDDYGEYKDSAFLVITTSKGAFTIVNYNEHNGYYGGFSLCAAEVDEGDIPTSTPAAP